MITEDAWRVRILDSAERPWGAGILLGGRYVLTAAHVVARALGADIRPDPPPGRVKFDLPMRPALRAREAEIACWLPPENDSGDIAGLSVVGPALRDVGEPVLARVSSAGTAQVVRIHGFPHSEPRRGLIARAQLAGYTGELVQMNRADTTGPAVEHGFSGAGVIADDTGKVLGITRAAARRASDRLGWMCPMEKIYWRPVTDTLQDESLRDRIEKLRRSLGSRATTKRQLLEVVGAAMAVPALADSRSRHTIVSELPLAFSLSIPRSTNDRADVASLFWICTQQPDWRDELCERLEQVERTERLRELARGLGE